MVHIAITHNVQQHSPHAVSIIIDKGGRRDWKHNRKVWAHVISSLVEARYARTFGKDGLGLLFYSCCNTHTHLIVKPYNQWLHPAGLAYFEFLLEKRLLAFTGLYYFLKLFSVEKVGELV